MEAVNPVDEHIGRKIRQRREELGVSLVSIGETIGVSYQQVQKYESGKNRIVCSRLFRVATALDMPISEFFPSVEEVSIPDESIATLLNAMNPETRRAIGKLIMSIAAPG